MFWVLALVACFLKVISRLLYLPVYYGSYLYVTWVIYMILKTQKHNIYNFFASRWFYSFSFFSSLLSSPFELHIGLVVFFKSLPACLCPSSGGSKGGGAGSRGCVGVCGGLSHCHLAWAGGRQAPRQDIEAAVWGEKVLRCAEAGWWFLLQCWCVLCEMICWGWCWCVLKLVILGVMTEV